MNNYYIYLLIFIIFLSSCFKKEEPIVPPILSESKQERGVILEPLTKRKRVALVIGNGNYRFSPLKNPINDARDMTNSLRNLGFKVIHKENASWQSMDEAIEDFQQLLGKGRVGLFYFSGHGVQIKNKNYLIPTDIKNISLPKVQYRSIPLGYVLSTMETANNDMNIIILDACRDNPFISKYKTLKKGLVVMQNGTDQRGTLIAYATSPNDVAAGSNGRNSPYTKHLLKFIHQPGLPIEMMFKRVRNSVMTETRKQQIPWESSSLYGKDFYFAGKISKEEQKRQEEIDTLEKKAKKIQEKLKKLKGKKQIKKIPKKVQKIDKQAERHKRVIPNW
jgi:uncharacterized caspase-like protein